MGAHAVVTLIAVGLGLAIIAAYLIQIARILWIVIDRLVTILGAVEAVTDKSQPVGAVVDDINRDLASSAEALEACVERLEQRREPTTATSGAPERSLGNGPRTVAPADTEPAGGGRGGWWKR